MGVQRIKQLAEGFRNDYSISIISRSIISRTCHIVLEIPLSRQYLTANFPDNRDNTLQPRLINDKKHISTISKTHSKLVLSARRRGQRLFRQTIRPF